MEIGALVVCVNSKSTERLVEGKTYEVTDLRACTCGIVGVGVGIMECLPNSGYYSCLCGRIALASPFRIYNSTRFVPLRANEQLEEQIFEAMKGKVETN